MTNIEETLRLRSYRLKEKNIPFIAYCHYKWGTSNGITVCRLEHYKDQTRTMPGDPKKKYEENTLATGFLRSLNKCILLGRKQYETTVIYAYIKPLSEVDRARVLDIVKALEFGEILD